MYQKRINNGNIITVSRLGTQRHYSLQKYLQRYWVKSEQISRCHPRFLCVYSQIRWWYHFSSLIRTYNFKHIQWMSKCVWIYLWICFFNFGLSLSHARTNHTKYDQHTIRTFVVKQVQWIPMHTSKQRKEKKSKNQKERLNVY